MSETTNLVGGANEPTVESPKTSTGSIWGKNTPEHYSPRVKNINEVKNIFFSYLSAFFQKFENFMLIFTLNSRDVCPN
jgi:hypothetical protein